MHSEGRDFGGRGSVPHRPELLRLRQGDPTHLSTAEGSFRVSEWLLKEKGEPERDDRFGNTPLQGAIWGDHKVIVNLLVEHGGQLLEVRRAKKKRKTTTSHTTPRR